MRTEIYQELSKENLIDSCNTPIDVLRNRLGFLEKMNQNKSYIHNMTKHIVENYETISTYYSKYKDYHFVTKTQFNIICEKFNLNVVSADHFKYINFNNVDQIQKFYAYPMDVIVEDKLNDFYTKYSKMFNVDKFRINKDTKIYVEYFKDFGLNLKVAYTHKKTLEDNITDYKNEPNYNSYYGGIVKEQKTLDDGTIITFTEIEPTIETINIKSKYDTPKSDLSVSFLVLETKEGYLIISEV